MQPHQDTKFNPGIEANSLLSSSPYRIIHHKNILGHESDLYFVSRSGRNSISISWRQVSAWNFNAPRRGKMDRHQASFESRLRGGGGEDLKSRKSPKFGKNYADAFHLGIRIFSSRIWNIPRAEARREAQLPRDWSYKLLWVMLIDFACVVDFSFSPPFFFFKSVSVRKSCHKSEISVMKFSVKNYSTGTILVLLRIRAGAEVVS